MPLFQPQELQDGDVTANKLAMPLQGIAGASAPIRQAPVCLMQDDETWSVTGAGVVGSRDFSAANAKVGDRCLKIAVAGAVTGTVTCELPMLVDTRFGVSVLLKMSALANLGIINMELFAGTLGTPEVGSHRAALWAGTAANDYGAVDGEWNWLHIPRQVFSAISSPTAWDDDHPTKTLSKVRLIFVATDAVDIHVGAIVSQAPERAGLVLGLDGPYESAYSVAYPALASRGWKGTAWTVCNNVGGESYMTLAHLQELHADGWDICSHGFSGAAFSDETATSVVRTDLAKARKWLAQNGFYRGSQFHSWMQNTGYSAVDPDTGEYAGDLAMKPGMFLGVRGGVGRKGYRRVNALYNTVGSFWNPTSWANLPYYALHTTDNDDFSVAAEPILDAAIANRTVLNTYTHQILASPSANDISLDFWTDFLAWMDANVYPKNADGGIEIMTPTEWYNWSVGRPGSIRAGYDGAVYQTDGAGTAKLTV